MTDRAAKEGFSEEVTEPGGEGRRHSGEGGKALCWRQSREAGEAGGGGGGRETQAGPSSSQRSGPQRASDQFLAACLH